MYSCTDDVTGDCYKTVEIICLVLRLYSVEFESNFFGDRRIEWGELVAQACEFTFSSASKVLGKLLWLKQNVGMSFYLPPWIIAIFACYWIDKSFKIGISELIALIAAKRRYCASVFNACLVAFNSQRALDLCFLFLFEWLQHSLDQHYRTVNVSGIDMHK